MMRKKINLLICALVFIVGVHAQSLRLRDINTGKIVTGDTVLIQSVYNNGWVGYETLDMLIAVENISNQTMETGAKKMEFERLQKDVMHTMCFAGGCYDTGTYVSPNHITLTPGASDSNFIAHYLFDNTVHIRGINHIAYVFYDVQNPDDSAVVYITYNTLVSNAGIKANAYKNIFSEPFPNPSHDFISFKRDVHASNFPVTLTIINILGETIQTIEIPNDKESISVITSSFKPGMYYFSFLENNSIETWKVVVSR
jgi:hypothetical protein